MQVTALQCPGCFAPVTPTGQAVMTCRFCGTSIAFQGGGAAGGGAGAPAAAGGYTGSALASGNVVYIEHAGPNVINVIKVVREHTGLGLREAKELVDRIPCPAADWSDTYKVQKFKEALIAAGARVR